MATVLKTVVAQVTVGSNPTPSARVSRFFTKGEALILAKITNLCKAL